MISFYHYLYFLFGGIIRLGCNQIVQSTRLSYLITIQGLKVALKKDKSTKIKKVE